MFLEGDFSVSDHSEDEVVHEDEKNIIDVQNDDNKMCVVKTQLSK